MNAHRFGLGLAALGRPAYITLGREEDLGGDRSVAAMRSRTWEVLDAAWAAGVRYFDAARSYGRAEEFLAGWLRERAIPAGTVSVGSKWGYAYVGGWRMDAEQQEVKELSAERLRAQLAESRELLGPYLSLYQIHSATAESGVLRDAEVLAVLRELRADGVAIGVTTTGPRQAETVDLAVEAGIFDTVQSTWNLLEPSAGPALARAYEAGLTVIVKEGVANGRLTARAAPPALAEAARERGVTPDALALAAVLARPWTGVVLSGAATTAQLDSNLSASGVKWTEDLDERLSGLAEPPGAYWSTRASLPWH
ncbi:aryl-alcohol dehydrogenase-like predicted oxidoreductase [Thermocatellispora tengchongensis]|uniref:Aryl-alcohol dehydrogenase-like predicted oxidoreductase n=1 Tax=Thermocatellispora tengchongensis TaxID=1073253 RepID=A0A840PH30_9ACTN|nr:aldo/keto reductase [Thermocatellispora tengchongensis]MBB5136437.1 aryl-alcohol dehydrogenase-like predicted oxidoreductase [Thermocatellispora tengchongensis]